MKLQLFLLALLLASTAVHEAGHWLAGKLFGYRCVGIRWIPPGIALRGPRGPNGIAPPLEAVLIALSGPIASAVSSAAIWASGYPALAFVWACCGVWELIPVIPHSDGHKIYVALKQLVCARMAA